MGKGCLHDTFQSGGKKLHVDIYTTGGSDPVILFIPGMGCHAGIYEEFLGTLSMKGFTVIGVDLPGHGKSQGPRGRFTFGEVMDSVSGLVTYAISRFNDRIGLMGTSLGGTYALYSSMHDSRIRTILCHNAMDIASDLHVPTRFPAVTRFMIRYLRSASRPFSRFPVPLRILVDWTKVIDDPGLLNELYRDPLMVWIYTIGAWLSFLDHVPETDLRGIHTPLKIIVGTEDRLFPPEYCRALSRRIGSGGASFEVIPGGHALPMESIPETVRIAAEWFGQTLNGSVAQTHS